MKNDMNKETKYFICRDRYALLKNKYNYTNAYIADALFVSTKTLYLYVSGKQHIPLDTLQTLGELFSVPCEWICGEGAITEYDFSSNYHSSKHANRFNNVQKYFLPRNKESYAQYDHITALLESLGILSTYKKLYYDSKSNDFFPYCSVDGIDMSLNEYVEYEIELFAGIQYITDRYIHSFVRAKRDEYAKANECPHYQPAEGIVNEPSYSSKMREIVSLFMQLSPEGKKEAIDMLSK